MSETKRIRCDRCGASRDGNPLVIGLEHTRCPRPAPGTFRELDNHPGRGTPETRGEST